MARDCDLCEDPVKPRDSTHLCSRCVKCLTGKRKTKLMAAAPKLLAALKRLVNDSMYKDHHEASQMAIDAIALAESYPCPSPSTAASARVPRSRSGSWKTKKRRRR